MSGDGNIKTTIEMNRQVWNAARGRAIAQGLTIGEYFERLARLAADDTRTERRALELPDL